MSVTLELPPDIDEELTVHAEREGISPSDHAALLVSLANALTSDERPSKFKEAVRAFLVSKNLDADRFAVAFDTLVAACLAQHDVGKVSNEFQAAQSERAFTDDLKKWRSSVVHAPLDLSSQVMSADAKPVERLIQRAGRLNRQKEPRRQAPVDVPAANAATEPGGGRTLDFSLRSDSPEDADPSGPHREAILMETIVKNSKLGRTQQRRFETLRRKNQSEELTKSESDELQGLWEQVERMNVTRLDALVTLAEQRRLSVPALMKELGIPEQMDAF